MFLVRLVFACCIDAGISTNIIYITGKENAQYSLHNVHTKDQWVLKLATHTNILDALKPLLGDDIVLLDSRFICKYPCNEIEDGEKYVAWHQDVR